MKPDFDPANIDIFEVEREARRLRAEATANGLRTARAWISGLFASSAQDTRKSAA